jgi:hypothetical protein
MSDYDALVDGERLKAIADRDAKWMPLRAKYDALVGAADALADAVRSVERGSAQEWSGDYYSVTCRLCGCEWTRRKDEDHERWCPVPELRATLATYRTIRKEGHR